MRPPAEDSATARVCLRSFRRAPSAAAMERSFGMAERITRSAPDASISRIKRLLPALAFDAVRAVPADASAANEGRAEPRNPAIAAWYRYGFFSHVLSPRPHVWAVRTADARYAKLEIVGYYCPGARPGCLTFRYVYQGDGSTRVETAREGELAQHRIAVIPG